jgi:putative CocE/NonD family hydrolase
MQKWPSSTLCPPNSTVIGTTHSYPVVIRSALVIYAQALSGDGSLSTVAPTAEPADKYSYDPADPTPTRGGGLCCDNNHQASGAFDQRPVEARSDVLVYSTPEFKEDFEVTGPITLELYANSSAVDTDFTGKLVDVWPNGYAQNLTDGILRDRWTAAIHPDHAQPTQGLQGGGVSQSSRGRRVPPTGPVLLPGRIKS